MSEEQENNQGAPHPHLDEATFASFRKILLLAGPLVLSQMGVMLMQIVDGVFLAHYSEEAIAAIGPSGLTFWMICGMFIGLAGYTNTFVAQYVGAKRPERVGAAVWQGIYLAIFAGLLLAAMSLGAKAIFATMGHEPAVRQEEIVYFEVLCWGGTAFILSAALSGFYAGRNDNLTVMLAHLAGGVTNAVLDWGMIFGHMGFERMGMAGAAWATVIGQSLQVAILGGLLFRKRFRSEFSTWRQRRLDGELLWRMVRYGFPNGLRYVVEIGAWTVFVMMVGRIDSVSLAATNIAWRINGMAFFPVIGLSIAVSMLVGQAQGAGRADLSRKATHRGLVIGQTWMASAAALMVICPGLLLRMFFKEVDTPQQIAVYEMSVKLLWFVAVYCLVDNFNIIFMAMLAGAGDTRWMLLTSGALHGGFMLMLGALSAWHAGIYTMWLAATVFICSMAIAWVIRFRSRVWESKRVIEHAPPDVNNPAFPGPDASA